MQDLVLSNMLLFFYVYILQVQFDPVNDPKKLAQHASSLSVENADAPDSKDAAGKYCTHSSIVQLYCIILFVHINYHTSSALN